MPTRSPAKADAAAAPDGGEERLVGVDRVLAVLSELGRHPAGTTLDEISRAVGSPKATVHRALGALRRAGFANQNGHGHYMLGDELLRLAFTYHEARPDHVQIQPSLDALAERFQESAHYAVLDGRSVVYRAKVDPRLGAAKLTSVIGGRNPAHSTGVGKALLAQRLLTLAEVKRWIGDATLERRTPKTIVSATGLHREFERIRTRGYSTDNQENEVGINCVAFAVSFISPDVPIGAVSVSGLTYRTPLSQLEHAAPEMRQILSSAGVLVA